MKKIFDDFTHCYSLSKTLRFRLIPQLKTSENIKKYNIISDGEKRSNNYHDVKPLFDRCHRQFIDLSLKDFEQIESLCRQRQMHLKLSKGYSFRILPALHKGYIHLPF